MFITSLFKHLTYQVFSPGTLLREKYEAFKELLRNDHQSQELIAELEIIYHDQLQIDSAFIAAKYEQLSVVMKSLVDNLITMSPLRYIALKDYLKKIDFYIRYHLAVMDYDYSPPFSLLMSEIPPGSDKLVGGKADHLAEIGRELDLPIPPGFAITARAFNYFCEYNDLRKRLDALLAQVEINAVASLETASAALTGLIKEAVMPPAIAEAIERGADYLQGLQDEPLKVAVRSSAVGEDAQLSFAGQYRTVVNVPREGLQQAYIEVLASKYSPRAIYYRVSHGYLDMETPMAVLFIPMIPARASGILYSRNPVRPTAPTMMIYSIWGSGEPLVNGSVAPDVWEVSRNGDPQVIRQEQGARDFKAILGPAGDLALVALEPGEEAQSPLSVAEAQKLAAWSQTLESHFLTPQDTEWCQDHEGTFYVLQSRPLHLDAAAPEEAEVCPVDQVANPVLLTGGERAASGVGIGKVVRVRGAEDLSRIPANAVVVASTPSPELAKIGGKISAVVTDTGSPAGHFASVARELGIPTLVNTRIATEVLKEGETVTVYADGGVVFAGAAAVLRHPACEIKSTKPENPLMNRLRRVLDYISPLNLLEPGSAAFAPEFCKTLHDIIRFAHEKAVQEMFALGGRRAKTLKGAKKLVTDIPILLHVLDVGQGIHPRAAADKEIHLSDIANPPLAAVWKGLSHPAIVWPRDFRYLDWEELDRISAGIFSLEAAWLASYAILSQDYLNLNIRFGYHFAVLDTFCSPRSEDNYISFRFKGGGGDPENRQRRVEFLSRILTEHGFTVKRKGDLIDAQVWRLPSETLLEKVEVIGLLLGTTRLLDLTLKDEETVESLVERFRRGDYHFGPFQP